jgi:hypothetical protein
VTAVLHSPDRRNYIGGVYEFYCIVLLSVVGFLASGYLLFEISSVDTAKRFWPYSPADNLQDYQSFVRAARIGLGAMVAWFLSVILIELGLRETINQ